MLTRRLAALLQIRPGEATLVALVAGLFACIEAGRGIGANAADALFFLRFGVEFLPVMFLLLGVANFVVSLSYAAGLGRFDRRRFLSALPGVLAVTLFVEWIALRFGASTAPVLYPVLWITVNIVGSTLGLLAWNVAGEVCDARQAKRLFSLFASAGILGGVAGNFVTGPVAGVIGADNLLVLYAALLLIDLTLARRITRQFFRPAVSPGARQSFLTEVRAGFDFVRRSPLLKLMALTSVLFSILYFSISFPFSRAVSSAFPDEAGVAGFLGLFSGVATTVTFGVSLLVANRLYARVGVVNAVLLFPATYFAGFVLLALDFSLAGAAIARLAQVVVLGGIAGTAYSTFFNVVPSERRGQVRSFDSGVPEQVGVALSGVLLILGERVLTPAQIFGAGMILSVVCGFLIWRMRRRYGEALIAALRAGRVEVFAESEQAFAGLRGNADAIRVAAGALHDPRPATRRLGVEMLARMHARATAGEVATLLTDPDAEVRIAAVQVLADLDARDQANALVVSLVDVDARVQASALRALTQLQPDRASPRLLSMVEKLLRDSDQTVQAQAAMALARLGAVDAVLPRLYVWLREASPSVRAQALSVMGEMDPAKIDRVQVVDALGDASPVVRRAACHALARTQAEAAIDPLIGRLSDPDPGVRSAAAAALKSFGAVARRVANVLLDDDERAIEAALDALAPEDVDLPVVLSEYAGREIARVRARRELAWALPDTGRVTELLRAALATRASAGEQRLVKTVGLLGYPEAMAQVAQGLKTHDAALRASAIEALEALGHRQLAQQIIPLLDDAPVVDRLSVRAAIARLLTSPDGWLRTLAAGVIGELNLTELSTDVHALASDADPLARETARRVSAGWRGEGSMETLQTVSTLERILLLRDVPLFADLTPDDLKQIADIAREQWYAAGAVICREGEYGDAMFILVAGEARVFKESIGGEKVLARRGAGEFIGEMAVIESMPRMASARAEGEVRALVIGGEAFKAIVRDRPEVALAMLRVLSRRLRERE